MSNTFAHKTLGKIFFRRCRTSLTHYNHIRHDVPTLTLTIGVRLPLSVCKKSLFKFYDYLFWTTNQINRYRWVYWDQYTTSRDFCLFGNAGLRSLNEWKCFSIRKVYIASDIPTYSYLRLVYSKGLNKEEIMGRFVNESLGLVNYINL